MPGEAMNPLPGNTLAVCKQAAQAPGQHRITPSGGRLGKTVRKLIEGIAIMRMDMREAETEGGAGNHEQGSSKAHKLTVSSITTKRLHCTNGEQGVRTHGHINGRA